MASVLVVDPERDSVELLGGILREAGHTCTSSDTFSAATSALESSHYDLVLADLARGRDGGLEFLRSSRLRFPDLPVVMMAAGGSAADAIAALRNGASDFLTKPFVSEEVHYVVNKALAGAARQAGKPPVMGAPPRTSLLGESAEMQALRDLIRRAAAGSATVLVRGESGTGKELVARAVHEESARRDAAFVKIDCSAFPDTLLESELFGYEKGAFTGAVARKPGRVELAEGGTLFLDEIGELSSLMQTKLLRLLQDRAFERLGGTRTVEVDVRFVLATHRDLETMVANGTFREDLYYRLNVLPLFVPPLRARRDDIELLAREFCARFARANGRPDAALGSDAIKALRGQRWPGNVRQLENFIERLVVFAERPVIGASDVERELVQKPQFKTQSTSTQSEMATPKAPSDEPLVEVVRIAERNALLTALKKAAGNRSVAARVLGVSRATLYNKLRELGIDEN
jgi:two-component system response regulator AtoC